MLARNIQPLAWRRMMLAIAVSFVNMPNCSLQKKLRAMKCGKRKDHWQHTKPFRENRRALSSMHRNKATSWFLSVVTPCHAWHPVVNVRQVRWAHWLHTSRESTNSRSLHDHGHDSRDGMQPRSFDTQRTRAMDRLPPHTSYLGVSTIHAVRPRELHHQFHQFHCHLHRLERLTLADLAR